MSYGRKEKGIQKRLAWGWSLWRWMSAGAKPLTLAENLFRVVEEEVRDESQNVG